MVADIPIFVWRTYLSCLQFCIRVQKVEVIVLIMYQMEQMLLAMLILLPEVMWRQMLEPDCLLSLIDIDMKYLCL